MLTHVCCLLPLWLAALTTRHISHLGWLCRQTDIVLVIYNVKKVLPYWLSSVELTVQAVSPQVR